jgi:hypothetical protein
VFFRSAVVDDVGQQGLVEFTIPGDGLVRLTGFVVHATAGGRAGMGLQFGELGANRRALANFMIRWSHLAQVAELETQQRQQLTRLAR